MGTDALIVIRYDLGVIIDMISVMRYTYISFANRFLLLVEFDLPSASRVGEFHG